MSGCTLSPLDAFTMAMEVIIRASRRRALGFWDVTTTNQNIHG